MTTVVNDVTTLNPVKVERVVQFSTQEALIDFIKTTDAPISIAGGRFSMGGQTSALGTLNIDMCKLNKIVNYEPKNKLIRVEAGCTWFDIQQVINTDHLAIKIMQTYSNFTVGGSLSVNCHGRYIGFGPVISSVRKIKVLLPDGQIVVASPKRNKDLFSSVIGCYGAVGIILEVELELADNVKVKQLSQRMNFKDYLDYFVKNIRGNNSVVFHNADIFTDTYNEINAVSWVETNEDVTVSNELIQRQQVYAVNRYFVWAFTETPFGKWRRRCIYNPLYFKVKRVHWRNYEASYDVLELEPKSRVESTYVLQEYFIPTERIYDFSDKMAEIFKRYKVNVLNISIRHANQDLGSNLAWAKEEVFCFVVYYKEYKSSESRVDVPVWTRELMRAAAASQGSFYLPYQPHASYKMFQEAYPNYQSLFDMKKEKDASYRLRNALWDKYYQEWLMPSGVKVYNRNHEFDLFDSSEWYDKIFLFLQNVFDIHEPKRFMYLLVSLRETQRDSRALYRAALYHLTKVKGLSAPFRALRSLSKQKEVMVSQMQTYKGFGDVRHYLEIGTTGRYVKGLKKALGFRQGQVDLMHNMEPGYSPVDIAERSGFQHDFGFIKTEDYLSLEQNRYDLITCFAGLHHFELDELEKVVGAIAGALKVDGTFALREHDCQSENMKVFVSLIHTIFNIGTEEPEQANHDEVRHFRSVSDWVHILEKYSLALVCEPKYQAHDPSENALLIFKKSDV